MLRSDFGSALMSGALELVEIKGSLNVPNDNKLILNETEKPEGSILIELYFRYDFIYIF
jgi:hypothetical protein